MSDEQHKDWCEEHEEGEGCATDWRGAEDAERGNQLLHRILQRPGEKPVIQFNLAGPAGGQAVADFAPETLSGFGGDLSGDVAMALTL